MEDTAVNKLDALGNSIPSEHSFGSKVDSLEAEEDHSYLMTGIDSFDTLHAVKKEEDKLNVLGNSITSELSEELPTLDAFGTTAEKGDLAELKEDLLELDGHYLKQ